MGPSGVFAKPNFGLNCLELLLGGISVGAVMNFFLVEDLGSTLGAVYSVQIGFVIVSFLIVIGHLLDFSMNRKLLLTVSILSCLVWFIIGAFTCLLFLLTTSFGPVNAFFLSGIAAVNNAGIHLIDAIRHCQFCCQKEDDVLTEVPAKHYPEYLVPIDTSLQYARLSGE